MIPDPSSSLTEHFTWREALWLPRFERYATEADGVSPELLAMVEAHAERLERAREWIGAPFVVHCWYRPEAYNRLVNGAPASAHLSGLATDFHVQGFDCATVIRRILGAGVLATWGLRMENNGPAPTWIHLDSRSPGPGGRYFNP